MAENLLLALVQSPLIWEDPEANRQMFDEKLQGLSVGTDIVILPEMFTTGFTMQPDKFEAEEGPRTVEWMRSQAKRHKAAICGSMVYKDLHEHYNRLFFVNPDGEFRTYDKRHTFTLAGEDRVYASGKSKTVFTYKGFSICPMICYDLRFPVWSRNVEDYHLLLYVANWPAPRVQAWDALLKARAIENMAYCAGVNRIGRDTTGHEYSGHSAVYDPLGNTVVFSEEEGISYAELSMSQLMENRKRLKFLDDRDAFTLEL